MILLTYSKTLVKGRTLSLFKTSFKILMAWHIGQSLGLESISLLFLDLSKHLLVHWLGHLSLAFLSPLLLLCPWPMASGPWLSDSSPLSTLSLSSQVSPWACWDLQTPALNSHQRDQFPPPGAPLSTTQELLPCLGHPLQAAASQVLAQKLLVHIQQVLAPLKLLQPKDSKFWKALDAEGGNKNLHWRQFAGSAIVHSAGSHSVGQ